jgi:hypothetical protein
VFDAVRTWFSWAVPLIVTDPVGGLLTVLVTAAVAALATLSIVTGTNTVFIVFGLSRVGAGRLMGMGTMVGVPIGI